MTFPLFKTFSTSMYCLVLVSIYVVSTTTWLATSHTRHYTKAEVHDDVVVNEGLGLVSDLGHGQDICL